MIAHSSDVRRCIGLKVLTTLMQHAVCCCTPQTIWCLSLLPPMGWLSSGIKRASA